MSSVPRLHVVTDDRVLSREHWRSVAVSVLEAGREALALHLRGSHASGASLFRVAASLLPEARASGAALIVNDRVDVALATGMDGVHLRERSMSATQARALVGPDRLIGVSRHGGDAVRPDGVTGADYAFVGTIFPTPSHEGLPGIGISGLHDAVGSADGLPVFGIGGIGVAHVARIMGAGATGVAVLRGVWDRACPAEAVHEYLNAIEDHIDD